MLPRERREELVDEIREHLDAALAGAAPDDELAVRNAIERLGPPEAIVLAAVESAAPEPRARTPWLEIAALVALVVPVGGWLAGIVLVGVSRVWSRREKLLGIALAVLPVIVGFLLFAVGTSGSSGDVEVFEPGTGPSAIGEPDSDSSTNPLWYAAAIPLFVPGLMSAVFLGWRLRRHRTA